MAKLSGLIGLLILLGGGAGPVSAQIALTVFQTVPRDVCDREALRAAREYGVPPDIMRAITRLETGRAVDGVLQPWPWTVNHAGKGSWHDSRAEVSRYLQTLVDDGKRNFDIGCFQVNYRWHGQHFSSISDMLDPRQNADYAARFLIDLRDELGSWRRAVASYHSRTSYFANKYTARFDRIIRNLDETPTDAGQWQDAPQERSAQVAPVPFLSVDQGGVPFLMIGEGN